jgi:hypothetical protein
MTADLISRHAISVTTTLEACRFPVVITAPQRVSGITQEAAHRAESGQHNAPS